MAIELDHVMVLAREQVKSAQELAELLGVPWSEKTLGPFSAVHVNQGLTLDFIRPTKRFRLSTSAFASQSKSSMKFSTAWSKPASRTEATYAARLTSKSTHPMADVWSTGTCPKGPSGKC
jgi:hypothetical protein